MTKLTQIIMEVDNMSLIKLSEIEKRIEKIKEIQDIIEDQNGSIYLIEELVTMENAIHDLNLLVNEAEQKADRLFKHSLDQELAVAKGVCEFPLDCKERKTCKKNRCNYDVCTNGYCYRMS